MKFGILFILLSGLTVTAQNLEIPDANFETFLLINYDANEDGFISAGEASSVVEMDCSGHDIRNLTGLEHFTNLTVFSSVINPLEVMPPIDGLTQLQTITIGNSFLKSMSWLSELTSLQSISLHYNTLWELPDLSGLVELEALNIHGNLLMRQPRIPDGLVFFYMTDNLIFELQQLDLLQALGYEFWAWYNFLDERACPAAVGTANVIQGGILSFRRALTAFPYNVVQMEHLIKVVNIGLEEYNLDCSEP